MASANFNDTLKLASLASVPCALVRKHYWLPVLGNSRLMGRDVATCFTCYCLVNSFTHTLSSQVLSWFFSLLCFEIAFSKQHKSLQGDIQVLSACFQDRSSFFTISATPERNGQDMRYMVAIQTQMQFVPSSRENHNNPDLCQSCSSQDLNCKSCELMGS